MNCFYDETGVSYSGQYEDNIFDDESRLRHLLFTRRYVLESLANFLDGLCLGVGVLLAK